MTYINYFQPTPQDTNPGLRTFLPDFPDCTAPTWQTFSEYHCPCLWVRDLA